MADVERKVIETESTGVNENGDAVQERTSRVESKSDPKVAVVNFVWYVYGLIAFLLGIRMLLKLLGANSGNAFVSFVYSISGVLSAPFDSIFGVASAEAGQTRSVFEPSILVAIAVYGLIAWGIAKLLTLNEK